MIRILILGITGFTGKSFHSFLSQNINIENEEIYGADIKPINYSNRNFFHTDFSNTERAKDILRKLRPDYIVNFIGRFGSSSFNEMVQTNALLTSNILQSCIDISFFPQKILLIGSAAEYGLPKYVPIDETHPCFPNTFYGLSKKIQTNIMNFYHTNFNLNVVLARTFNIIGKNISHELAIGSFLKQIRDANGTSKDTSKSSISVGNLSTRRDYLDIRDVASAYWLLLQNGIPGEIYNVCSGYSVKIEEILTKMIRFSGKSLLIEEESKRIKPNDLLDIYGDNSKLKQLGWKIRYNLDESIQDLFEN